MKKLLDAHEFSRYNKEWVEKSKYCGCFYCLTVVPSNSIKEYIDEGLSDKKESSTVKTALCPKCRIDSLIPDVAGYDLSKQFLEEMHDFWFG
jgi:hypothetical protein